MIPYTCTCNVTKLAHKTKVLCGFMNQNWHKALNLLIMMICFKTLLYLLWSQQQRPSGDEHSATTEHMASSVHVTCHINAHILPCVAPGL